MTIRDYAVEQVAKRLGRLAFEIRRAQRKMDDEAVHDLRVSIRRLSQALRVFANLLPAGEARKVRKRLGTVMKLAGVVRDLDVARAMIAGAALEGTDALSARLAEERKEARRELLEEVRRFAERDFTSRWRQRLRLGHAKEAPP